MCFRSEAPFNSWRALAAGIGITSKHSTFALRECRMFICDANSQHSDLQYIFWRRILCCGNHNMNPSAQRLYDRIGGQEGVATLLRHFYADVRQHRLIGPVFNQHITDWPVHLAKIGEFWSRITGGPSNYSGQMPAKHFGLGLNPRHFGAWLQLWDSNCHCYLKPREATEMSQLAHEIGLRLKRIISNEATRQENAKRPAPFSLFTHDFSQPFCN